jgi:hypothetical protein
MLHIGAMAVFGCDVYWILVDVLLPPPLTGLRHAIDTNYTNLLITKFRL